jgi:hypothetical protein
MREKLVVGALAGALLVTLCPARGWAQAAKAPADSPAAVAEARYFAGQKLYNDKEYDKALAEFRASYEATPSPNSHLYIARCLRQLGRIAAAYDEYSKVILEAADRMVAEPKYEPTQKAASAERATLKDRIATLSVAMPPGVPDAKLTVGPEEVPAARWSGDITVAAGEVRVRVEAPGRTPFERTLTVTAGQNQRLAVELPVAPPAGAPGASPSRVPRMPGFVRPVAYATAGVGVVGFIVGGALGAKASSRYSQLQQECGGRCGPSHQGEVDAGRAETAGSKAGLAIGIVGVLGGATLWTLDYLGRRDKPAVGSITVKVGASPLAPGASVEGTF